MLTPSRAPTLNSRRPTTGALERKVGDMNHAVTSAMTHVATFCGSCNCGCPELYLDEGAPPERRVVITDDFGQRIQMSREQLHDLVSDVKSGVLDQLLAPVG